MLEVAVSKSKHIFSMFSCVFYAMLVLSFILILLVTSIGFRPAEGEDALQAIVAGDR